MQMDFIKNVFIKIYSNGKERIRMNKKGAPLMGELSEYEISQK